MMTRNDDNRYDFKEEEKNRNVSVLLREITMITDEHYTYYLSSLYNKPINRLHIGGNFLFGPSPTAACHFKIRFHFVSSRINLNTIRYDSDFRQRSRKQKVKKKSKNSRTK